MIICQLENINWSLPGYGEWCRIIYTLYDDRSLSRKIQYIGKPSEFDSGRIMPTDKYNEIIRIFNEELPLDGKIRMDMRDGAGWSLNVFNKHRTPIHEIAGYFSEYRTFEKIVPVFTVIFDSDLETETVKKRKPLYLIPIFFMCSFLLVLAVVSLDQTYTFISKQEPIPVLANAKGFARTDISETPAETATEVIPTPTQVPTATAVPATPTAARPVIPTATVPYNLPLYNGGGVVPTVPYYLTGAPLFDTKKNNRGRVCGSSGANLRDKPSTGSTKARLVSYGVHFTVIDGPVENGGHTWWKVTVDNNYGTGWMAESTSSNQLMCPD